MASSLGILGSENRTQTFLGVSEMASAKMASAIGVRIDDVGSILKCRIGFPFEENSACFLPVRVAPGVDTEFPYRVRIVDRGVDCRDPVCRHRFRFLDFFSQTFRAPPGYPGKIPGYPAQKSLISLVSRDVSNFLAPTRSRGRPLPHWKISGPRSLGLGSFSVPEICVLLFLYGFERRHLASPALL